MKTFVIPGDDLVEMPAARFLAIKRMMKTLCFWPLGLRPKVYLEAYWDFDGSLVIHYA